MYIAYVQATKAATPQNDFFVGVCRFKFNFQCGIQREVGGLRHGRKVEATKPRGGHLLY